MVNINSGGGGIVFGGGTASGKGGDIVIGPRVTEAVLALSPSQFGDLISALGDLKASLIRAQIHRDFVARVAAAEQQIIAGDGKVGAESMRQLLGQLRFAGRGDDAVSAAVNRVAAPVRARPPVDVFVSYKREEREHVEPLVRALGEMAITVWFDAQLQPGRSFTDEICEELDGCRTQIVCWSPAAIQSDWVRGEAEYGRARAVLAPIKLAPCNLPPPFNMLHAEDFSGWRGELEHEGWRKLLGVLEARLPRPGLVDLARLLASRDQAGLLAWTSAHPSDPFVVRAAGA